jgi:hypothetical protein
MARLVILLCAALVLLLGGPAPPAGAGEEWCETDPVVAVRTPAGNVVPVFVLTGAAGLEHLPAAQAASYAYTVQSLAGGAATRVRLEVRVPTVPVGAPFPTRATASTGPLGTGTVLDSATGSSGEAMRLTFTLGVP